MIITAADIMKLVGVSLMTSPTSYNVTVVLCFSLCDKMSDVTDLPTQPDEQVIFFQFESKLNCDIY